MMGKNYCFLGASGKNYKIYSSIFTPGFRRIKTCGCWNWFRHIKTRICCSCKRAWRGLNRNMLSGNLLTGNLWTNLKQHWISPIRSHHESACCVYSQSFSSRILTTMFLLFSIRLWIRNRVSALQPGKNQKNVEKENLNIFHSFLAEDANQTKPSFSLYSVSFVWFLARISRKVGCISPISTKDPTFVSSFLKIRYPLITEHMYTRKDFPIWTIYWLPYQGLVIIIRVFFSI